MKNLFSALADSIEDLVRDRKLRWMVAIPSLIATILLVVGIASRVSQFVNVTLLVTSLFLGAVVLVMAMARRYMRRQIIQKSKVVGRYADSIFRTQESNPSYFTIESWDEAQAVGKKGDTTIVREIRIKAGQYPVPAVWARASRSSEENLSSGIKSKIKVEARYINADGTDGTRLVSSFNWESDKGIRITVFFDHDLEALTSALIRLTIYWPRYSADLLTGEASKEYWKFHRSIDSLKASITYSKSFAPAGVRVTELAGSPAPSVQKGRADGSSSVSLFVPDVIPGREYGYHVEIA